MNPLIGDGNYRRPSHRDSGDGRVTGDSRRSPWQGLKKREPPAKPPSAEKLAEQRRLLAEELAKPRAQRIGKLKSLKAGDFTEAELAEIARGCRR